MGKLLLSAAAGAFSAAVFAGLIWIGLVIVRVPHQNWPMGGFFIAVVLVGGVLGVLKEIADQRRTSRNQAAAEELKLSFQEAPDSLVWPSSLVRLVQEGRVSKCRQCWRGEYCGVPLEVADVHYAVSTDEGTSHRQRTVYAWDFNDPSLPSFSVTRPIRGLVVVASRLLGSTEGLIGFQGDDLPPDDAKAVRDFNSVFMVANRSSTDDEPAIRRILTPTVMKMLTDLKLCMVAAEGRIAFWQGNHVVAGEQRQRIVEQTRLLLDHVRSGRSDKAGATVAPDPHIEARALWDLLPYGCGVVAAMCGFFVGALVFTFSAAERKVDLPMMPIIVFGSALAFGLVGWLLGKMVLRWRY